MKNHEPRSQKWIARTLKTYTRDNEAVQALLSLVDVAPIPSLIEIESWTPEQCLLAEDWAGACHLSASDNNNRVPARPAHLVPYELKHPQRTPRQVAIECVREMGGDNGVCFHPTTAQWARLEAGIAQMMGRQGDIMQNTCHFTDAEINLFAAGEDGEMREWFGKLNGFDQAQLAMLQIFEELDDEGVPQGLAGVRLHEPPPAAGRLDPAKAWPFPTGSAA